MPKLLVMDSIFHMYNLSDFSDKAYFKLTLYTVHVILKPV